VITAAALRLLLCDCCSATAAPPPREWWRLLCCLLRRKVLWQTFRHDGREKSSRPTQACRPRRACRGLPNAENSLCIVSPGNHKFNWALPGACLWLPSRPTRLCNPLYPSIPFRIHPSPAPNSPALLIRRSWLPDQRELLLPDLRALASGSESSCFRITELLLLRIQVRCARRSTC
jgi:hypothetical protein